MSQSTSDQEPVRFREITPALEFCAWVMVALAPALRLANGPPVTADQWYLQIAVATLSLLAAVSLRIYNWRAPMPSQEDMDDSAPATDRPVDSARSTAPNPLLLGTSIRLAAAGLLLLTALLKAASPATAVASAGAYGLSYDFVMLVVMLELAVATLLLSGWQPRVAIAVAAGLFGVFAAYSLVLARSGVAGCGCFGSLPVSPTQTFILDLVMLALLAVAWRASGVAPRPAPGRLLAVGVMHGVVSVAALLLMVANRPATLAGNPAIDPNAEIVVLEPDAWIGRRLPIAAYLQPEIDLDEGTWTLLIYHHDCPDCQAVLPDYVQLANADGVEPSQRVGLVEMPPYGPSVEHGRATLLQLSEDIQWFVQTPVEVTVQDGIVTHVAQDAQMLPSRLEAVQLLKAFGLTIYTCSTMIRSPGILLMPETTPAPAPARAQRSGNRNRRCASRGDSQLQASDRARSSAFARAGPRGMEGPRSGKFSGGTGPQLSITSRSTASLSRSRRNDQRKLRYDNNLKAARSPRARVTGGRRS